MEQVENGSVIRYGNEQEAVKIMIVGADLELEFPRFIPSVSRLSPPGTP
jgi:hypothetical protein